MFSSSASQVSTAANYIEDVFSTYLYTGNGYISPNLTQSINNSIDLSTYGGMVWIKCRSTAYNNAIFDTSRGSPQKLVSNSTASQFNDTGSLTSFNSNGFSLGSDSGTSTVNAGGQTYTSWTFRKQAKFFDVVTYTGTGANRTIAHNLGSVPGCIITKRTDTTGNWITYHRSLGNTDFVNLNTTAATSADNGAWNNTSPTSTEFSLGTGNTNVNGGTYVAYLFAHDAGGFGAAGTDNVISCGSYTGNGSTNGPTITLGYEPQWLLIKRATGGTGNWYMFDNMRGLSLSNDILLQANTAGAESTLTSEGVTPNATGFSIYGVSTNLNTSSSSYVYIAIRRGPMKTPTSGTSVFAPFTGNDNATYTPNFPLDMAWDANRAGNIDNTIIGARLSGYQSVLVTSSTAAEKTNALTIPFFQSNTTFNFGGIFNASSAMYAFRRAPGFFDVVCYTGTGVATTVSHNLGAAPELMIVKSRNNSTDWAVYHSALGATKWIELNSTAAESTASSVWNDTAPTASVFSVGTNIRTNASAYTYVAYLFATIAGISKVGSYTGTGTTLQINCGFSSGARFVLIKRRSANGDWYVWDSARGIVAGNDPYLLLNSTAAEVTSTDYIDTYSAGFEISSTAPTEINGLGSSFIFLAIA